MDYKGFSGDLEKKGYLFSGIWEALVFIFRDLGSNLIGSPAEIKKINLKKKTHLKGKTYISFCF